MTLSLWQQSDCGRRWKARRGFYLVQFGWFENTQLNKGQIESQPSLQWVLLWNPQNIFKWPLFRREEGVDRSASCSSLTLQTFFGKCITVFPLYQCPVHRFSQLGLRQQSLTEAFPLKHTLPRTVSCWTRRWALCVLPAPLSPEITIHCREQEHHSEFITYLSAEQRIQLKHLIFTWSELYVTMDW